MDNFKGRVVIVTGAVGNLGTAVVRAFRAAGAKLVLVDRGTGRLARRFPDLKDSPDAWFINAVDLTDAEVVDAMAEVARQRFGRIDVLVNVVGGFRFGSRVHEMTLEDLDLMLNINLRTTFLTSRAVIPIMLAQGFGKIVNVSSRAALQGGARAAAYSIAKSGVVRLTESMSAELKSQGINVNCVLPGTLNTPENWESMPKADFSTWVAPEDVANVLLFLASDAARAVHGAAIPVFGRG